jgi:hypothetical protein
MSKGSELSDIDKRLVLAMREIGRGHGAAKTFCASLGLPKPVSHHPSRQSHGFLHNVFQAWKSPGNSQFDYKSWILNRN